jgi:hypothetical protein
MTANGKELAERLRGGWTQVIAGSPNPPGTEILRLTITARVNCGKSGLASVK